MAVGTLNVQQITGDGTEVTFAAATATDGDQFPNGGRVALRVVNGSAGNVVVTVKSYAAAGSGNDDDMTVTVAAGKTIDIGPFPQARYNSSGKALVICAPATDVTIAAVQL